MATVFIVGSLRIINEVVVIVLIAIGLITYSPVVLIAVASLIAIGGFIIRKTTKSRLQVISDIKKTLAPGTGTAINNAIRGFLEVVSFRASKAVRDQYLKKTAQLYRIDSNLQVLNLAPSKLYEVLAVSGVSFAIIVSLIKGDTNEELLESPDPHGLERLSGHAIDESIEQSGIQHEKQLLHPESNRKCSCDIASHEKWRIRRGLVDLAQGKD